LNREYGNRNSEEVALTENESDYLSQQRLGRIATASPDGRPHVVPVAYEFDGKYLYFGGWNLEKSLKYRTIRKNPNVAFVVDDLASVRPWSPRGIEIKGTAETMEERGVPYVRIRPISKRSWGLARKG
jgi:pyridoxamine 5'-phosphate oxidase family protein